MSYPDQEAVRESVFLHVLRGDAEALATSLSMLEGSIDFRIEPDGQTPLSAAVDHGIVEAIAVLLERGADPHQLTVTDHTTLMTAAWKGATEPARLLLKAGVDPSLRRQDGATALDLALRMGHHSIVELLAPLTPPAWSAADRAKFEAQYPDLFAPVVSLLDRAGANGDSGEICVISGDRKSRFAGDLYLRLLEAAPIANLRFVIDSDHGFDHICRFLTFRETSLEDLPRSEFGHYPPGFPHRLVREAGFLPIAINAFSDIFALASPELRDGRVVLCSSSSDGGMKLEEISSNLRDFLRRVRPVSDIRSDVTFPEK